jgi:hypothetical protein
MCHPEVTEPPFVLVAFTLQDVAAEDPKDLKLQT